MATKPKSKSGAAKKAAGRRAVPRKSLRLKAKRVPSATLASRVKTRTVESRRTPAEPAPTRSSSQRVRSKQFAGAVQAYEAAIKSMHAEQFEKATKTFLNLIAEYPDEPEIQERAKVLLHACEKKIHEKERTVLRSADDHYNVGIADLNRRELVSAIEHLQHALKLTPKADHVLYALAAASALQGDRERALEHLKQSIHYRLENRFLAIRDTDFVALQEDPDFKQLVKPPEK